MDSINEGKQQPAACFAALFAPVLGQLVLRQASPCSTRTNQFDSDNMSVQRRQTGLLTLFYYSVIGFLSKRVSFLQLRFEVSAQWQYGNGRLTLKELIQTKRTRWQPV